MSRVYIEWRIRKPEEYKAYKRKYEKTAGRKEWKKKWHKTEVAKAIGKRYRDRHSAQLKANRDLNRKIRKEFVNACKNRPCADCRGWFDPWIMEFDHLDPALKSMNVSEMAHTGLPLTTIKLEIDKCEVVCANCHADRTYKRWHNAKL